MNDTDGFSVAQFEQDVAGHSMVVIRDNGVERHLRFKREGTMCMHFDLLTWPGYLCFTGDMGTYVFRRLIDMFEFFRRSDADRRYRIDLRYWAEKVEADDKWDGLRTWSAQEFRSRVRSYFEGSTDDWTDERKAALWDEIDEQVCYFADEEMRAMVALYDFEHDGFRFTDWESDCRVWSHRFQWCCHALAWAIDTYDKTRASAS